MPGPDLHARADEVFSRGWPEFIFHDPVADQHMERVREWFAELNLLLVDGQDRIVAGGWGVPVRWKGDVEGPRFVRICEVKVWLRRCSRTSLGQWTVFAPGEVAQIDSTPLDVLVRLDDGVVGKVELTGMIDVATRTVPAAVLRPTTKSVDASVLLARTLTPEVMRPGWVDALRMSRSVLPYHRLLGIDERVEHAAARHTASVSAKKTRHSPSRNPPAVPAMLLSDEAADDAGAQNAAATWPTCVDGSKEATPLSLRRPPTPHPNGNRQPARHARAPWSQGARTRYG